MAIVQLFEEGANSFLFSLFTISPTDSPSYFFSIPLCLLLVKGRRVVVRSDLMTVLSDNNLRGT